MTSEEKARMVKMLIRALTDGITGGYEWVEFRDVKVRMLRAKYSFQIDELKQWLGDLVLTGKIETKNEDEKVFYRMRDQSLEKKTSGEPLRIVATPPRKDWPSWARDKFDQMDLEIDKYHKEAHSYKVRLDEMETLIMEHKQEQTRAVSIYGSPNALAELTTQVALTPKFADLSPAEHEFVASVGLASGLNPIFHLHAWTQWKSVKQDGAWKKIKVLSILPDYKALMASSDDPIMTEERRLTKAEMATRGIPQAAIDEGSIAYEMLGYNLKHANLAKSAGIPYKPSKGYGWWAALKDEEVWNKKEKKYAKTGKRIANDTPNARDGEWVAKKRALRDLFNQTADLRLKFAQVAGAEVVDDGWQFTGDPDAIEGEFTATETVPPIVEEPVVIEVVPDDTEPVVFNGETGEVIDGAPGTSFWLDDAQRKQFWTSNTSAGRNASDVAKLWRIPKKDADNYDAQSWVDATAHYANVGEAMVALMLSAKNES